MANVNKTVAERLRETAENHVGVSTCTTMLNVVWDSSKCREGSCTDCRKKMLLTLADMIESEQAELRNQSVDVAALNLLCDKLECGDANHRATAEQIRKAINGADVDVLHFCPMCGHDLMGGE